MEEVIPRAPIARPRATNPPPPKTDDVKHDEVQLQGAYDYRKKRKRFDNWLKKIWTRKNVTLKQQVLVFSSIEVTAKF
jgi:hypothetical protein